MSNNILINNNFFKTHNLENSSALSEVINKRDEKGRNYLFWAIHNKEYKLIKELIQKGINTNISPNLSAMNYAVYKDDVKLIKCLISCGLNVNELDEIESTPLIYAVLYNKLHSINYLISNGACLEHKDVLGNSALTLAYDLRIEYLIQKFELIIKSEEK